MWEDAHEKWIFCACPLFSPVSDAGCHRNDAVLDLLANTWHSDETRVSQLVPLRLVFCLRLARTRCHFRSSPLGATVHIADEEVEFHRVNSEYAGKMTDKSLLTARGGGWLLRRAVNRAQAGGLSKAGPLTAITLACSASMTSSVCCASASAISFRASRSCPFRYSAHAMRS